jgi:hypothetical protein
MTMDIARHALGTISTHSAHRAMAAKISQHHHDHVHHGSASPGHVNLQEGTTLSRHVRR